jgi:hypothetical protein
MNEKRYFVIQNSKINLGNQNKYILLYNFLLRKKNIEENDSKIHYIIEKSYEEMNTIMDNWCKNCDENFSGGKMRGDRGEHIETYVKNVIHMFRDVYAINVCAMKGSENKKELKIPGTQIKKDHQVDIHIYKDDIFINANKGRQNYEK